MCGGSTGGIEQQRAGHPQVRSADGDRRDSSQIRYLPGAAEPLDDARRRSSASTARGCVRAGPARIEDLGAARSSVPRRAAPAGGGSSRPRAARACALASVAQTNESPGQPDEPGPSPASHARRSRPHRPAARRGGASGAPRRRASSGTYSRVWSVCGDGQVAAVVGGQDEQVVGPEQRRATRATRGVDLAQGAGEARDVVTVTVDLIGLDQVREHEPASAARGSARSVSASATCVGRARMLDVDPRRRRTAARPCRPCAPATPSLLELLEVAAAGRRDREVAPTVGALEAPGAPANGRAITRPTACSGGSALADLRADRVQLLGLDGVDVRGDLQHRVLARVDDQRAGLEVLARRSARSPRCRCRGGCRSRRGRLRPTRSATISSGKPSG